MTIRARLVALALDYSGVDCSTARARYLELVAGPGDTEPAQRAYLSAPRTSGCALVVRGLWRLAGLEDRRLVGRYRPGMAVADVVAIARAAGAWVADLTRSPEPGDVVLVGGDLSRDGGVEHVYTIVGSSPEGVLSVDGGQRDAAGQQAIRERRRRWTRDARGALWDQVERGSDPGSGARRRVKGFVDVSRLPWPATVAPPEPASPGGAELPRRPTLRRGSRGPAVAEVQRLLGLEDDGVYGPRTEAAVRGAQERAGLEVDGVCGPRTWAALDAGG